METKRFLFSVSSACITLMLSCSGDKKDYRYCVFAEQEKCVRANVKSCKDGILSDSCPYNQPSSSSTSYKAGCKATKNTSTEYCFNGVMKKYEFLTYGGQKYKTVEIGTQTWMAENLNYNVARSECYEDDIDNCKKYGRLYDWATAMDLAPKCNSNSCASLVSAKHKGICPDGWHIPSSKEWDILIKYVDQSFVSYINNDAGTKLKASSDWDNNGNGKDTHGFSALPGGNSKLSGYFNDAGYRGYWWNATESSSESYTYYHYMHYYDENVYWLECNKTYLLSVRCLKD
jgi:uncharacterized protein (TIGR02145 family)